LGTEVTRIDILKMLLYAPGPSGTPNSPIIGKTRLQKEVFLAQKELRDRGIKRKYGFMPYHYGPFSRQLYFDINLLKSKGLVEEQTYETAQAGIYRKFKLTSKGVHDIEGLIQNEDLKDIYEAVKKVKHTYDGMALRDLVQFTHQKFPEYARNQ